jgi:beta-N-acetylhexosaminidase
MPVRRVTMRRMSPQRSSSPKALTVVGAVLAILVVVAVAVFFFRDRYYQSHAAPPAEQAPQAPAVELPPPGPSACGEGDALLSQMSTRQKLAQLLMVGVTGLDDAQSVVARDQVGGIMIGSWTDLSMMGDPLKGLAASASPLPLAVSTDEEGGRVSRLKSLIGVQPSARELVAQGKTTDEVYAIARDRGAAMRNLGITVDFAPDADVSDQPDDTVIGDRSFSADPQVVAEYAGAYGRGLHEAGVMPVFKHFPGHGHASGDSHEGGVVTPPLADLIANDLVPYQTLVTQPGAAVMVGHMNVPGLTNGEQASLSPAAYQLLRSGSGYGAPGFGGLVFTDDLSSMGAINQSYTVPEAVLKALQAGADVALWITTDEVPAVLDRLEAAVGSGELAPAQVDQSVLRIAAAKGKKPDCGG